MKEQYHKLLIMQMFWNGGKQKQAEVALHGYLDVALECLESPMGWKMCNIHEKKEKALQMVCDALGVR